MDVGLYNKDQKQAFGSHGTLIGNWVEERELRRATGHARTADYWNRWAADDTKARVFSYGADANTTAPTQSVMKATYPAPHAHAYPNARDKFFHRTRPRYWSDATADKALAATKGTAQAQAQADALAHGLPINSAFKSTVSLGQHQTALTTTYGSTFLPSLSAPASAAHGMGVVKKDWSTPKSEWLQSLHAHRHGPWRDPANAQHLMAHNPYVSPYAQSARPNGGTIGGASGGGANSARLRSPGAGGAAAAAAAARPQSVPNGAQRVRSPSAAGAAGAGAGAAAPASPVRRAATPAAATRAAAVIKPVSPPPAGLATNVTLDQNA